MKNGELSLKDVFDPFYDREEEFFKLFEHLRNKQKPEDGSCNPIVFFDGISEEEKKIVAWHYKREERRLQAMLAPSDPDPQEAGGLTPYHPGMDAATLFRLCHPSTQSSKKPNASVLLNKVLNKCDFRRFRSQFYFGNIPLFQGQLIYPGNGDIFLPWDDEKVKSILYQLLQDDIADYGSPQPLKQVAELLSLHPRVRVEYTTDCIQRVYFRNCCLNALTGIPRQSGACDFFTSYLDFDYPAPNDPIPATPHFDNFLATASGGNQAWIETVLEMLGVIIVADPAVKNFFLLQGVGDSGKSVLGDLISSLFNPSAVAHLDIFRFKDRFSLGGLENCRVNVSMDLSDGRVNSEAVATIKMLTGGDHVTIEQKFKDAKPGFLNCKLVFGSNYPLTLTKPDEAFMARLVNIPFLYTIPKEHQDPSLRDKLRRERPGIAVKAIAAYRRLRERNYQFPELGFPSFSCVCGYVPMTELLETFIDQLCEFCGSDVFTPTSVLAEAFKQFCELHHALGFQDTVQFSRSLNQLCTGRIQRDKQRVNGVPVNGYHGIRLK